MTSMQVYFDAQVRRLLGFGALSIKGSWVYENKGTDILVRSIFDNVQVIVWKSVVLAVLFISAYSVCQGAKHADFTKDVLPVLRRHCFECHGPQVQEGGLRFDDRNEFFAGGYSGPAMIAGKPSESELLRRVSLNRLHDDAMPPVGPGLSAREGAVLRSWITQGAELPQDIPQQKHWAYIPPVKHSPPVGVSPEISIIETTIDSWVAAAHMEKDLQFSVAAKRSQLIRRLSFDVTGLPPSPEAVAAF